MADSIRVLALLALAVAWGGKLDALVLTAAVLIGACEAVSEPALLVIAPSLIHADADESSVTAAYGLLEGLRNSATIIGPVTAAALVAAFSANVGAAAAAFAFAVSAAATRWAGSRWVAEQDRTATDLVHAADGPATDADHTRGSTQDSTEGDGEEQESLLRSALGGLGILWRIRWLRNVELLAVVHVVFAVGPWMVALPVAILADQHTAVTYGSLLGAFAAGAVVGALLGGRVHGSARGTIALVLLALFGVTAMAPAITGSLPFLIILFALGGVGQQAFDIVKMGALRSQVPKNLHGRAFSADFFFSFAALPLGQVIRAAALRFMAATTILTWAGVLVLVTTAIPLFSAETRRFAAAPSESPTLVEV